MNRGLWLFIPACLLLLSTLAAGEAPGAAAPGLPQPTAPGMARLEIYPARLDLEGPVDARRLLVFGWTAAGDRLDLTQEARVEIPGAAAATEATAGPERAGPIAHLGGDGYIEPLKDGEAAIKVSAAGLEASLPLTVKGQGERKPVSFIRDVEPILNKVGCTSGTCHGAAKGKNGFHLSLRGYDPEFDHMALVDDLSGRRFNRADPGQSLMLLKPTQGVPHQGGFLFDTASRHYQTLERWIAEGVQFDGHETRRVARLEVVPGDVVLADGGQVQQLLVLARYPDGGTRDVTRDAFFTSSAFTVAEVSPTGQVSSLRRGETTIIVRYEGQFGAASITVLGDRSGYAWKAVPEYNYIDGLIYAKLQKVKALPSELASEEEFIRRVHLDVIGLPPTPEEVRAYLAEVGGPGKDEPTSAAGAAAHAEASIQARRARFVDRLLERQEFVDHWALKWSDLLQANRKYLGNKGVWSFRNWIREAVAADMPFDDFARRLLTGKGGTYTHPEASYYRIAREPNIAMETTTQLFLGVRFMCNKCHDHPFEQWTQNQYYELSAFFAETAIKGGTRAGEEIIFERQGGEVKHPKSGKVVEASFPFQFGVELPRADSRREALAQWLTHPRNPYFAKSLTNRVWSYFFGRGLIDPVDDIRAGNPPSNPKLLEALTADLVEHGFSLRHLIRTIATSRTYQLSVEANRWNEDDVANFSHQSPRRLSAEQLLDAISIASGSTVRFEGIPLGFLAKQLPDPKVNEGGFLDLFGRPPRESPCECERRSEVSLSQALNLVNGPTITEAVADPAGRIARGLAAGLTDQAMIEELYLAALSRRPREADFKLAQDYLAGGGEKSENYQDLLWALVNSPAFLFNR